MKKLFLLLGLGLGLLPAMAAQSMAVKIWAVQQGEGTTVPEVGEVTNCTAAAVLAATPETGYRFDYWYYYDLTGKPQTSRDNPLTLPYKGGNQYNVYVYFSNLVNTVTFESEGGTEPEFPEERSLPWQQTWGFKYGELPTTTRSYYSFGGWYTEPEGGGDRIVESTVESIEGDHPLYARWTPNRYTIQYHANGGKGTMSSQNCVCGTEKTLLTFKFTYGNYHPADPCWNTMADGSGVAYADRETVLDIGGETSNYEKVTLYAQWDKNTYRVRFLPGEGAGAMTDQVFEADEEKALKACTLTAPTGRHFTHWLCEATGERYADCQVVSGLATEHGAVVELTAEWSESYTVAFDGNGAETGEMASQAFERGVEQALRPNAFGRTGFTFLSWADATNRTTYADGAVVSNLVASGLTNILRANWATNSYQLVFSPDCGYFGGTNAALDCKYNLEYVLPECGYTNYVGVFRGWARSRGAAAADYQPGDKVSRLSAEDGAEVVLYAVWQSTLSDYSQAVGLTNLVLKSQTFQSANPWVAQKGEKRDASGSVADRASQSALYAETPGPGVLTFRWWHQGGAQTNFNFLVNGGNTGYHPEAVAEERRYEVVAAGGSRVMWTSDEPEGWLYLAEVRWYPGKSDNLWTLKFSANGGEATAAMTNRSVAVGAAVTLPTEAESPVREGYSFLGWDLSETAVKATYAAGETVSLPAKVNEEITLYAVWRKEITSNLSKAVGCDNLELLTSADDHAWEVCTGGVGVQSAAVDNFFKSSVMVAEPVGPGTLTFVWRLEAGASAADYYLEVDGTRVYGSKLGLSTAATTLTRDFSDSQPHVVKWGSDSTDLKRLHVDSVRWYPGGAVQVSYQDARGQARTVAVPMTWVNEHFTAAEIAAAGSVEALLKSPSLKRSATGGVLEYFRDYLADTDPKDPDDQLTFTAVELRDGAVRLKWQPDLGSAREYLILGKRELGEPEWGYPTNAATRFFALDVNLPE